MSITIENHQYEWIENWAKLPKTAGHAHHGLFITGKNEVITADNSEPKILILDTEGNLKKSFSLPVKENHGITHEVFENKEYLWVADTGGQVLQCDLDGNIVKRLERSDLGIPDEVVFKPTCVAIDPQTKNIFVSDGYGSMKIYVLNREFEKLFTIDGTEGAGRFNTCHWVYFDTRKENPELYVADRASNRIQIFDNKGVFKRCLDQGLLTPSVFTICGEYMIVGELKARLVVLDMNDNIVAEIGAGLDNTLKPGWPNRLNSENVKVAPNDLKIGEFNSPHGVSADKDGNIYISEWLLGDRFIKLKKIS